MVEVGDGRTPVNRVLLKKNLLFREVPVPNRGRKLGLKPPTTANILG